MKEKLLNPVHKSEMESKSDGALFLAISFAAILIFVILVYLKLSGADYIDAQKIGFAQVSTTSDVVRSQNKIQELMQAKLPMQKDMMNRPTSNQIQGRWFLTYGHNSMVRFTITVDKFEMVILDLAQDSVQSYSKGIIKYDGQTGKLTLYPTKDPFKREGVAGGVNYKVMTMRRYDVFLAQERGDDSLFFIAPEDEVISKRFHPVFLHVDYAGAPVLKFSPINVSKGK